MSAIADEKFFRRILAGLILATAASGIGASYAFIAWPAP
jgi:hypothetical protein